jgi:hypothetical protein
MRLVVGDASWAADIPQWVLNAVASERMIQGFAELMKPGELPEEVGDAEVVAYLMPVSMRAPMPHYYVEIYFFCTARLCQRVGKPILDFMEAKLARGLTRDEERELEELRRDLWRKRGGKVRTPLFDALAEFKKEAQREERQTKPPQPVTWGNSMSLFPETGNGA